jgi:hypothetical protein
VHGRALAALEELLGMAFDQPRRPPRVARGHGVADGVVDQPMALAPAGRVAVQRLEPLGPFPLQAGLMSSHVLAEVEHVADRVAILRAGELVATEAIEVLRQRAPRRVEIRFAAPVPAAAFEWLTGVREVQVDGDLLRCLVEGGADALVKAAAQFPLVSLTSHEPDLEEIFLTYYTAEGSGRRAA